MLKIQDTSTPVLVLRSDSHGGLNIMRSLGRMGVRVHNLDPNRWAPTFFSRYCKQKFYWDIEGRPPLESVEYLLQIGRKMDRPSILIPTTDRTALFVADYGHLLKEQFLFQNQQPELTHALCSKKEMFYLARRHNIPTPDAAFPACRDDVVNFLKHARFPIMLKGIDGQRLWERTRKKMFIVTSERELLDKYDAIEDPLNPNLMLQEFIPGGDDVVWMFNGYFNENSDCLAAFTGRKIRQAPVYTGATCLGICLENKPVEETTKKFMKAIGYKGILDIGYRYDARDGKYKVLDINPRIGATFRLFVDKNGMDVARALYLDFTEQPVFSMPVVEGRKWVVEDLDLVSSYRYYQDGKLTLKGWITSFRGVEEAAFLASDDPLPILPMCIGRLVELFRRILRKFSAARPLLRKISINDGDGGRENVPGTPKSHSGDYSLECKSDKLSSQEKILGLSGRELRP